MTLHLSRILSRLPGTIYLWLGTLIFASSGSVTQKLIEIGQAHLVNGRNPISLCNVLFVGNICAFLLMALFFQGEYKLGRLKKLQRGDWTALTLVGILSGAIAPALIFSALDLTSVTNVVLIGRLEPLVTLILSMWFLGSRVNKWTIAGSVITFTGVVLIAILGGAGEMMTVMGGFRLGRGELFVVVAAFVSSIATIISKLRLDGVSLAIFSIYRTLIGTVVFFLLANLLYGREHFAEAFSPFLWGWMLVYAAIIVILGQLCWLMGLKKSTSAGISLASSCNPVLAIAMAFLILGEKPSMAQYAGGGVILLGIIFNLIGTKSQDKLPSTTPGNMMRMMNGFKGF